MTQPASPLGAAIVEARARWPELPATPDLAYDFAAAVDERVAGEAERDAAIARLALPDLYLVTCALRGDRGALAAFEKLVRIEAERAVAKLGAHAPAAEDVVQELLVKLLVAAPGQAVKLVAFAGHGAVTAWLRVAAVRTAISLGRRKQEVATEDDALASIADESDDQALAFMKTSYRTEFKRAFAAAFAELPRRQRTLLRLQVIDQLTFDEIAAFYQVSRATAGRHLAEARAQLVAGTQGKLGETLGASPEELAELMRMVASTLYATLPRLLEATREPTAEAEALAMASRQSPPPA